MDDFAGSADAIAEKLVAGGMDPQQAMMMALRMAQSRQQADQSILGGVPTQPPTSDVPPATEILGGDPSKLFQRQPTTMERIKDLPKDVLGAGEALVSMGSLAALAPASMLYALRPGQKTQGDPMEFALRNMYMPRSERGPSHLAGLGEVLESLPQTGPLPELQAFTGVGRGVGRQLAEKGRQAGRAMAPAAANVAEDILRRQGLLMDVVKPKGGNWLTGSVENALEGLKQRTAGRSDPKETMAEMKRVYPPEVIETLSSETRAIVTAGMQDLERKISLNNWIDRNLTNYVKKEMATPEDPVRKLAEQGITHLPENAAQAGSWIPENLGVTRMNEGFDPLGAGQNELAKNWETLSDTAINVSPASKHTAPLTQSEIRRGYKSTVDENPWLTKVAPDTRIYYPEPGEIDGLGFDHIVDVLRQDLAEGRIRPEQLNKVSMEQAVRRTYEYDQEMAKKMREAQIKATEGMPTFKEYPEQGFKWVELKSEDDPKLTESALKYEGETMGHCVGGYCPDVLEGRSRIFSLRDEKGEPHVTVEVQPVKMSQSEAASQARGEGLKGFEFAERVMNLMEGKDVPPNIVQIKGKQNRKPKDEYLPFVQDFVRSGNWSKVGDPQNAGLRRYTDVFNDAEQRKIEALNLPVPDHMWLTGEEIQTLHNAINPEGKRLKYNASGQIVGDSYKQGGSVNHKAVASARRALEKAMAKGGEVKMGTGGSMLGTVAGKAAAAGKKSTQWAQEAAAAKRAPAKSKEEIEAIARRMAAQTQPGFVRASEEQSINPAGKSQLLYEMEQRTPMVVESTIADRPVPNVDYEQQLGKVIVGVPGDPTMGQVAVPGSLDAPTRGGKQLMQVGDVRPETPVQLYGGPRYGANLDETFWASNLSPARAVQNLVQEMAQKYGAEQVLGKYIKMSPESSRFAMHNLDALISVLQPEKLDKDKVELLNNLVRKGNPKHKFPEFAGFEDPINVLLQAQMNSKLRKQISEVLEKPSVAKQVGFPFPGKVVQTAITEPELRNVETGVTGFAMGKMNPEGKLSFSSHPTYDYDIPGQAIGRSKYLIPSEMSFPDFTAWYRSRPDVQAKVDPINMMKSYGPRQVIDQQYIDEIKMYEEAMKRLTGKKKGGLMKKSSKLPKVIKSGKVGGLSALRK